MALKNIYNRRLVADTSSKACWICYKPSSTVLITPESDDWFHICPGHLKDRKFALPQDGEDPAEVKRKADLANEIEVVKAEYAEKLKKRAEKKAKRDKDKDKDKSEKKAEEKEDKEEEKQDEKAKEEKVKALETKAEPKADEGPRVFALQRNFFQMRLDRRRNAEVAKRNRERLKNPTTFPSVPSGDL